MKKGILIAAILVALILLIGTLIFIKYGQNKEGSKTATMGGWLFQINAPEGIEHILIRDDGEDINILNEQEIIAFTKVSNWTEPFESWSQSDWINYVHTGNMCSLNDEGNEICMLLPYERYKILLTEYMEKNSINGTIVDSKVANFYIEGTE